MKITTLTFTLLLPAAACSAECQNAATQTEMNLCAQQNFEKSDAELNAAYAELKAKLDDPTAKRLTAAQRAWISFRDAECVFSGSAVEGGSAAPMVMSMCLEELTRARASQLKTHLDCPEGDLACVARFQ